MNVIDKTLEEAGLLEFYNLNASVNCFIAGGACTRVFFNAPDLGLSDLDMYVSGEYTEFIASVLLDSGNFSLIRSNDLADTYLNVFSKTTIQLVKTHYGTGVDELAAQKYLLGTFDISACQLVYKFGQLTDCGTGAKELLERGLMRIYNQDRLDRVFKYLQRYPLKLDFEHQTTVLVTELIREGLFTKLNTTNKVIDYTSYAE